MKKLIAVMLAVLMLALTLAGQVSGKDVEVALIEDNKIIVKLQETDF